MIPFLRWLEGLNAVLRDRMLLLVVASYGLAAALPAAGVCIRDATLVNVQTGLAPVRVTIPAFLLAILLLGAGLRVQGERVRAVIRRPAMIVAGIVANLTVPVIYLFLLVPLLGFWHNPDEVAAIVIGLGLVASMPVAGSSTGWAQHAGGGYGPQPWHGACLHLAEPANNSCDARVAGCSLASSGRGRFPPDCWSRDGRVSRRLGPDTLASGHRLEAAPPDEVDENRRGGVRATGHVELAGTLLRECLRLLAASPG